MNLPFRQTMMTATLFLTASFFFVSRALGAAEQYFAIEVVDDQTGRGVPLVQLETVNNRRYFTDSAGLVAFNEPGLMDQKVFFTVTSHGYEFPADGFGYHGLPLQTTPVGMRRSRSSD